MAENIKTMGIVLKSMQHTADAARKLEIFSPTMGRFFAVIRGVEKPKAKLAAAASPFCFGEFVLAERGGFYTVIDCSVEDTFYELAYNLDGYVLSCGMLEITSKLSQEGEANFELFKLLLDALKVIVYEKANPSAVFIKFVIECLELSGFGFDLSTCGVCGKDVSQDELAALVYEGSGVLCGNCINKIQSVRLEKGEWAILRNIANVELDRISTLKFSSREHLNSCMKLILKQFYYRTGEKIQSLNKYF